MAALAKVSFLSFFYDQLKDVVCANEGRNLQASNATDALKLSDNLGVHTASKNGDGWSVLGDKASNVAGVGHDDHKVNVKVEDSADC